MNLPWLLFFGILLAVANVLGGFLLAGSGPARSGARTLKYLLALGAGFMFAAIFIELLPETVRLWSSEQPESLNGALGPSSGVLSAMTLVVAGYLLIHLFEHTVAPHFHFGAETHHEAIMRPAAAYSAIGGLSIHTFFDGVSIAAAFLVSYRVGLLFFLAILLHKIPEGFTAASIMLVSGRSALSARFATLFIGLASLAGVISVAFVQSRTTQAYIYALPFSAGVTLYVAASDLIPEVNRTEQKNPVVSIVVFVGVALFYLLHRWLEA